jgi:hypothetical protein
MLSGEILRVKKMIDYMMNFLKCLIYSVKNQ